MVNATILPFPAAGGVKAPLRPSSTAAAGDDFAGAMDGALEPSRPARRDATGARAPRRLDAARPSESARNEAAASIRKAANPGKTVSGRARGRGAGAGRAASPRRAGDEAPTASSIMLANPMPPAALVDDGRSGAVTPPTAGNCRSLASTTGDYRFSISVSIRISSETVIVFEFA